MSHRTHVLGSSQVGVRVCNDEFINGDVVEEMLTRHSAVITKVLEHLQLILNYRKRARFYNALANPWIGKFETGTVIFVHPSPPMFPLKPVI